MPRAPTAREDAKQKQTGGLFHKSNWNHTDATFIPLRDVVFKKIACGGKRGQRANREFVKWARLSDSIA